MIRVVILGENGSVHIQKWIQAIKDYSEISLHVISFDRGPKYEGVSYHYLKQFTNSKLDYFINAPRVKKLIAKIQPNVVHAHYATSYGYLGANANFHPLIITGWGADIFDSPKSFLMRRILVESFKKADAITVLSKITKKEIHKLTSKEVELIPFGVDIFKFKNINLPKGHIIRIGTVRTLSEKYGIEYLIRAFANVSQRHNNVRLEIVGDGPLREFLESLTKELKIDNLVTFHGYINQNTEFERYINIMSNFDIFAILSILDSETFGVAAVEASSCGLPVIATNVGGLPEVIDDNITGILVPPKDVSSTAEAIETLVTNDELRLKMGLLGRKKVESEYYWRDNVDKMIELYKRISKK